MTFADPQQTAARTKSQSRHIAPDSVRDSPQFAGPTGERQKDETAKIIKRDKSVKARRDPIVAFVEWLVPSTSQKKRTVSRKRMPRLQRM